MVQMPVNAGQQALKTALSGFTNVQNLAA